MNTNQLLKCVRDSDPLLNLYCEGVYPLDKIPKPSGNPHCVIVNLDPSSKPGSHWVTIFVDECGTGEFFDSYGRKPEKRQIIQYLKRNSKLFKHNPIALQSPYSAVCGQYCIYYCYHRIRGQSMEEILRDFAEKDREINDMLVIDWVNSHFEIETELFDMEFMLNQVCRALCGE